MQLEVTRDLKPIIVQINKNRKLGYYMACMREKLNNPDTIKDVLTNLGKVIAMKQNKMSIKMPKLYVKTFQFTKHVRLPFYT